MGARTPRRVYSIMYNLITSQPGAKDLEKHKALVNDPQVGNRVRQPGAFGPSECCDLRVVSAFSRSASEAFGRV